MENFHEPKKEIFVFPDLKKEFGEIERTAKIFYPQNPEGFTRAFLEKAKQSKLVDLNEEIWSKLENTDSFDISKNDWEKIDEHVQYTNDTTGSQRDWHKFQKLFTENHTVDAPIILKYKDIFHKVSGNTRLMVARALGNTPKVLLVEMENKIKY